MKKNLLDPLSWILNPPNRSRIKDLRSRKAILIILALIFSFNVHIAHAQSFPDLPIAHPFRTAITVLQTRGIVKGADDGNFYPDQTG
jgi:hypothetical protein